MKVTILQLGDDKFRLRVETKDEFGKRRFQYETVRGDRAAAEARRDVLQRGGSISAARVDTFDEFFEKWASDRLAYGEIRDTTADIYRRQVRHFQRLLGHKRLTDFTRQDIDHAWRALLKTHNPPHVRDIAKCVKTVFGGAVQAGLIPVNPAALAKTPQNKRAPKETTLDKDQMALLIERSKDWGPLGLLVRFALATGCRRGEICGLQWQDIDFDKGTVSIKRGIRDINGQVLVGPPKTKASMRTISLPSSILEELRAIRGEGTDWVFPSTNGKVRSTVLLSHQIVYHFRKIGLGKFSLHDLRHAHATYLLQKKMPLKAVSQRLGHGNVNITLGIYAHVMPGDDEVLADTINRIL